MGKEGPQSDTVSEALGDVTDLDGTELEEPSKDEDVDGPRILFYQETNTEAGAYLVAEANAQYSL